MPAVSLTRMNDNSSQFVKSRLVFLRFLITGLRFDISYGKIKKFIFLLYFLQKLSYFEQKLPSNFAKPWTVNGFMFISRGNANKSWNLTATSLKIVKNAQKIKNLQKFFQKTKRKQKRTFPNRNRIVLIEWPKQGVIF